MDVDLLRIIDGCGLLLGGGGFLVRLGSMTWQIEENEISNSI